MGEESELALKDSLSKGLSDDFLFNPEAVGEEREEVSEVLVLRR